MSKRKESSSTTAKTSKDAKAAKPSSLTLTEMLAEIEKLQTPEDIERSAIKLHKDLLHEWNKGKERDLKDIGILLGGAKVSFHTTNKQKMKCTKVSGDPTVQQQGLRLTYLFLASN